MLNTQLKKNNTKPKIASKMAISQMASGSDIKFGATYGSTKTIQVMIQPIEKMPPPRYLVALSILNLTDEGLSTFLVEYLDAGTSSSVSQTGLLIDSGGSPPAFHDLSFSPVLKLGPDQLSHSAIFEQL